MEWLIAIPAMILTGLLGYCCGYVIGRSTGYNVGLTKCRRLLGRAVKHSLSPEQTAALTAALLDEERALL